MLYLFSVRLTCLSEGGIMRGRPWKKRSTHPKFLNFFAFHYKFFFNDLYKNIFTQKSICKLTRTRIEILGSIFKFQAQGRLKGILVKKRRIYFIYFLILLCKYTYFSKELINFPINLLIYVHVYDKKNYIIS